MCRPVSSFLVAAAAAVFSFHHTAHAVVVWSDDFTGQIEGAFPNRDFNGDSVNDWSLQSGDATMMQISAGVGEPAPSLTFNDASGTGQSVPRLQMTQFAPFSTSNDTPTFRISFDWKIEDFSSGATNEAFRFILRANNSQLAGNQLVIGFNRGNIFDGDASTADLTLYAGSPVNTSNLTPGATSAIGLIAGVGWEPGFDFGEYSATAADNDTDDLFYRFVLTYDFTTGQLDGTVTRLALDATNGLSATFTRSMTPGLEFSNTDVNDVLLLASTASVTGLSRFDNFLVESIPEPSVSLALALGAATLVSRRRRLA